MGPFPEKQQSNHNFIHGLGCLRFQDKVPVNLRHDSPRDGRTPLAERFYGRCFIVLHIEDCVELRDLQQVVDLLGQVQQF